MTWCDVMNNPRSKYKNQEISLVNNICCIGVPGNTERRRSEVFVELLTLEGSSIYSDICTTGLYYLLKA